MIDIPANYLWTLLLHNMILASVCYGTGVWVQRLNIRVNYTRKINHFALMVIPFGLATVLPYRADVFTITATLVVFVMTTAIFCRPIRDRVPMVATAFASIDRPEDRPHTLLWIVSQAIVSYAVLVAVLFLLRGDPKWMAVPLIVTGLGDGLAEPVGVRFGRHRYRVPSLAAGRRYTRSLEGSACVAAVSIAVVLVLGGDLSWGRWAVMLFAVAVCMTIAEAVSPHAWDAPLMYAVGGGVVWAVLHLP